MINDKRNETKSSPNQNGIDDDTFNLVSITLLFCYVFNIETISGNWITNDQSNM